MQVRNTYESWGAVHQAFHWFVVAAAVSQLVIGFIFANLPREDPSRGQLFGVHATLGLVILLVMLARLAWRLSNPVPRLPNTLTPLQKGIARATHWLFYILLIGLPIGGYLMVNAFGREVPFFGAKLPVLIPKNEAVGKAIVFAHVSGAIALVPLILLHASAALRHEFWLKDNTLRRMTPLPLRGGTVAPEGQRAFEGRAPATPERR